MNEVQSNQPMVTIALAEYVSAAVRRNEFRVIDKETADSVRAADPGETIAHIEDLSTGVYRLWDIETWKSSFCASERKRKLEASMEEIKAAKLAYQAKVDRCFSDLVNLAKRTPSEAYALIEQARNGEFEKLRLKYKL